MPNPLNLKDLKRMRGLFAYYAKWVNDFSTKIKPLSEATSFPLSKEAVRSIAVLKENLGSVTLMAINETLPFTVETDASNVAISATLNQRGKPVAFFSRTLLAHQRKYPAI